MGRDARSSRSAACPLPDAVRADPDAVSRRLRRAVRHARPRVFRPRRDLRVLGRGGAAISARSRPPDHLRRRMVDRRAWGRPAGARARAFSRRRVRTRRDHARSGRAPPAGRHVEALPPSRRRSRARRRRARARRRDRPRPRRRGSAARARGQRAHAVGHLVRRREPPGDDARVPRAVRVAPGSSGRRLPGPAAGSVCGRPRRPACRTRRSSCSRPASTTRRTSSTRSSPARWVSSWSRVATSCAATITCTCARPPARSRCTSCTGGSTTSTSTRCTSAPTRCSAAPGSSTRREPATSRSRTSSATASPTTRRSIRTCPR